MKVSPAEVPAWRLWIRAGAFVGIALYIAVGPLPHQMFGARYTKVLPRWRMFSGVSLNECAGWFERRDTEPPERIDDWYDRLKLDPGRTSHRRRAWISRPSSWAASCARRSAPAPTCGCTFVVHTAPEGGSIG